MISLERYKTSPEVVVKCKTGVFARGCDGQRLVFDQEDEQYHETDVPSRYVKKKLLQPVFIPVFSRYPTKVVFAVAKATQVSRAGLNWSPVFQASFFKNKGNPVFEGDEDLRYWFVGPGAELLRSPWDIERENYKLHKEDIVFVYLQACKYLSCEPQDLWKRHKNKLGKWNNWGFSFVSAAETIKERKFGIEIEFTGMTRKDAAEIVAAYFHSEAKFLDCYKIPDGKNRIWKVVSDASIIAESKKTEEVDNHFKCELVTPLCSFSDIPDIQQIVRNLRKGGMIANTSCGIHVHVDASDQTAESLCRLTDLMARKEDLIFEALGTLPARKEHYCKGVDRTFLHRINSSPKVISMDDIRSFWYDGTAENTSFHYHSSRYHAFNLHSLWQGKGIEYRMFNGTTHAGKVKAYIQFCLAVTDWSTHKENFESHTRATGSRYNHFENWLLELGLVGDEFKTARLHLLAVLKEKEERENAA